MADVRLGVDVGGTFTDLVAVTGDRVVTAKVPSTPEDQSLGVMRALETVDVDVEDLVTFAHGTTVATNALLERKGARVALVTTEGFRDVLEIARQDRPSLYDLTKHRPEALVPRELRFTVLERMGPDGEIEPLDEDGLAEVVSELLSAEVDAVAVCLLFSFLHPEHEQRIGEVLSKELDVLVVLSSEVLPEFREYERFSTTAADAYLSPKLTGYLANLQESVTEAGLPDPLVMQSSGGVVDIDVAARRAVTCVLSGPAGGATGAAHVAAASGFEDVLTFDMGGTSTDVAPIMKDQVQTRTESTVAGVALKTPVVDIHSVSAGGGSIAWVDQGSALRVGPHSAGAEPGPACYDRGGEEPTVTDANVMLGYISDGSELGGELTLKADLAEKALSMLGESLGMAAEDVAMGIIELANVEMVRALRVISVQRGFDPREFALVAFGGAGPMHACALCEELGIDTVLIPRASGVLSALGLAISDVRRDYVSPVLGEITSIDKGDLEDAFKSLEEKGGDDLDEPEFGRRVDLRYRGQSFELTVAADDLDDLEEGWHDEHERRYGYRMDEEPIEIVNVRVVATVSSDKPKLEEGKADEGESGRREANFDGEWIDAPVFDRLEMGSGSSVQGPALVELQEAIAVVRPGWGGEVDGSGTLILNRTRS
jgi:N-methylhydantoinase A